MYPWHFYLCLVASLALVGALILLAVFPIKLPLMPADHIPPKNKTRRLRRPQISPANTWDDWDGDEADL